MAEQEACASAVTEALNAAGEGGDGVDGAEARGESLLLPLLQGLLGGGGEKLLAGLGAAPADVVADVRRSLARLRAALAPPTPHPQARALLTLADRLEDALDAADRLDGCRRKSRRRSRANRHTVGVTHEELEEARRLVDRDQLALGPEPPTSSTASTISTETSTPERKQSVDDELSYHDAIASQRKRAPVFHTVNYEPPNIVNRDAKMVVERRTQAPKKPEFFRHSMADPVPHPTQPLPRMEKRPSDSKSSIAAIANKFDASARADREPIPRRVPVERPAPLIQRQPSREEPKHVSNLYRPLPPTYNFAAPPPAEEPLSNFNNSNNKKLRMKRANTIDIGKSLSGYRIDDNNDEDNAANRGPIVPEFKPQTENDRKFLAFMKKNESAGRETGIGQANWSNRFGNIKNTFESREREDHSSRSSSASSARRFWRAPEDVPPPAPAPRSRRLFHEPNKENIIKPPWVTERREPARVNIPKQMQVQTQAPKSFAPAPVVLHPVPPPASLVSPPTPSTPQQTVPQSPTKPLIVKPFVARPIPVNQFSHAPMSAFKPPAKVASPIMAPANIWSPPSINNAVSPTVEAPPIYPSKLEIHSPPAPSVPWATDTSGSSRVVSQTVNKFEDKYEPPYKPVAYDPPTPQTHAFSQPQKYPVKSIPSQNELSAPELVRRVDDAKFTDTVPKLDAQKLQIEFYERQIREKNRRSQAANGDREPVDRKPPPPPAYTVTDYTPSSGISSFVPLQRTPDIEKARAHKVDYLPDVVTNDTDCNRSGLSPTAPRGPLSPMAPRGPLSPTTPRTPLSPRTNNQELPHMYQNGDAKHTNGVKDDVTIEHGSVVTRVMRGPVRGAATITAGVRTRDERRPAADNLRGVLDKFSSPKHDVLNQIERKKKETVRSQVKASVPNGRSPHPLSPLTPPSQGGLGASRESILSSESAASGSSAPLSRSGSWHQMVLTPTSKSSSPRRVVARAKSMHLLAVPKLYEGGIAREEVSEKKRTVEAYFSGQVTNTRSPPAQRPRSIRAPVQPATLQTQAYSLGRSRTMPTVSELQFLDESNADDAFEDLVSALA